METNDKCVETMDCLEDINLDVDSEEDFDSLPKCSEVQEENSVTEEPVTVEDVYQEFNNTVARRVGIDTYKSREIMKHYALDPSVPTACKYLEVKYDASYPQVQGGTHGDTFSRVFGAHSSFLEMFLLEAQIKGPCWLDVTGVVVRTDALSHCSVEIACCKPEHVKNAATAAPPPPVVVAAVSIQSAADVAASGSNEIVMISCAINYQYAINDDAPNPPFQHQFCVFTQLAGSSLPCDLDESLAHHNNATTTTCQISRAESETELLRHFIAKLATADPDIIAGYDWPNHHMSRLCDRLKSVRECDQLSKVRGVCDVNGTRLDMKRALFTGRLLCDVKSSAKEFIKARTYDLDSLCKCVLNEARVDANVVWATQDSAHILRIMYELRAIPLALEISNLVGNCMRDTLMGGNAARSEFMLLHAFHAGNYIMPEKLRNSAEQHSRSKDSFTGGLVFDPKVGLYNKSLVLLMDFNSLYPSIIQEYNICMTNIPSALDFTKIVLPRPQPAAILPCVMRKLVETRRGVKQLLNSAHISEQARKHYKTKEIALKLIANAVCGALAYKNSRFYQINLAAVIAYKGRTILTNARDLVQTLSHDVIYGDTDSLMINTHASDYAIALEIGGRIKAAVNKAYKHVELGVDGVYKRLLLLRKKKYAGVLVAPSSDGAMCETQQVTGLDVVRRDWAPVACDAGLCILGHVLQGHGLARICQELVRLRRDLHANAFAASAFIVRKTLAKEPGAYADAHGHVLVALRRNRLKGARPFHAGDSVDYIICNDGTNRSPAQRAYLIEELNDCDHLTIDTQYYLTQQIRPIVTRICEPLANAQQIANALCLDLNTSTHMQASNKTQPINLCRVYKSKEGRYRNAKHFQFNCAMCEAPIAITPDNFTNVISKCPISDCVRLAPFQYVGRVQAELLVQMKRLRGKYEELVMACEDPLCEYTASGRSQQFVEAHPRCPECGDGVLYLMMREADVYMQLRYYLHSFSYYKQAAPKTTLDPEIEAACIVLKESVQTELDQSDYGTIQLGTLFEKCDSSNRRKLQRRREMKLLYVSEDSDA